MAATGKDYKGFIFVVHDEHGLLLLQCTRKKNKPLHWQLPGGHIDAPEFEAAVAISADPDEQLLWACQTGAARELYEETGMDVRDQLQRLEPASLRDRPEIDGKSGRKLLSNELKDRLFFFLPVSDSDFVSRGVAPVSGGGDHLRLRLSVEHSGFKFEPQPKTAAQLLKLHSGGKPTEALLLAMDRKSPEKSTPATERSAALHSSSAKRRTKREKDSGREITEPVNLFARSRNQQRDSKCCLFC